MNDSEKVGRWTFILTDLKKIKHEVNMYIEQVEWRYFCKNNWVWMTFGIFLVHGVGLRRRGVVPALEHETRGLLGRPTFGTGTGLLTEDPHYNLLSLSSPSET